MSDTPKIIKIKDGLYYPKGAANAKRSTNFGVGVFENFKLVAVEENAQGVCDPEKLQQHLGKILAQSKGHMTANQAKKLVDKAVNTAIATGELPPDEQAVAEKVNPRTKDLQEKTAPPESDEEAETIKSIPTPEWLYGELPPENMTKNDMIDWADGAEIELKATDKSSRGKVFAAIKDALNL
jgi:hypothetical protein